MKDYPLVAVLVPLHNGKEDTREFLESMRKVTYPHSKVIIIDDGSTDGTAEMLREYPETIVLEGDGNLWWSGAMNKGIEKAIDMGADYVLLMNNDTVVDPEFITVLVDTAEKNPGSIVSSKVYFYDQPQVIADAGGGRAMWPRGAYKLYVRGKRDEGQSDQPYDVQGATLGLLIKTSFFEDLGMMDAKSFPQYWADIDFTYRATKKGYRIIYEPRSRIWHREKATVTRGTAKKPSILATFIYLTTNIKSPQNFVHYVRFYFRHCPPHLLPIALAIFLFKYSLSTILKCLKRDISPY